MFDHSKDNKTVDVFVTLTDGRELFGSLACGLTANIGAALNGDGQFIEIKDNEGDSTFIGKHQIATLEQAKGGQRKKSSLEAATSEHSNWQDILGVASNSSADEVKEAYHSLAKQYHPDLYPAHMPAEMRRYATDRFTQINKAYDAYLELKMAA